jgi:alpha-glucosidase
LDLRKDGPALTHVHQVIKHWSKDYKIDGWRLDVAYDFRGSDGSDQHSFIRGVHDIVKDVSTEQLLIGETEWAEDPSPYTHGNELDAVMNYIGFGTPLTRWIVGKDLSATDFHRTIMHFLAKMSHENNIAMWNSISTHDTPRFLTRAGGDPWPMYLAIFAQMTMVGTPVIYNGDELGVFNNENHHEERQPMPWHIDPKSVPIFKVYQKLIGLRRELPALQSGGFMPLYVHDEKNIYAYARVPAIGEGEPVIVVLSNSGTTQTDIKIPAWLVSSAKVWKDQTHELGICGELVGGEYSAGADGMLNIPTLCGHYGMVLTASAK